MDTLTQIKIHIKNLLNPQWDQRFGDFDASDISYIFDPELAAIFLAATAANYQQLIALPSYPARDIYELQKAQFSALASVAQGMLEPEQLGFYLRELADLNAPHLSAALAELAAKFAADEGAKSPANNPLAALESYLANAQNTLQNTQPPGGETAVTGNFSSQKTASAAPHIPAPAHTTPAPAHTPVPAHTPAELAAALSLHAQQLLDPPLARSLAARCEQIAAGAYAMGFCGCFNAGKSSLINALLGADLLAASSAPETAAISSISAGEPGARIEYYTREEFARIAQQAALSPEAAALFARGYPERLDAEHIALCELSQHTGAASPRSHLVREIFIRTTAPILRANAHLIDTPGLDDAIISREQASRRKLRESDEIFYLSSATQALSSKDCEFLRSLAAEREHTPISLVLSKCDMVESAELPALCAYAKEKFCALLGRREGVKIFALSAESGQGMSVFTNYLLAQIDGKNAKTARLICAAVSTALREQLGICERLFAQNELQKAASAEQLERKNAIIAAQNEALNAVAQGFAQLGTELAAADFEDPSARFFLAKRLSERLESEFSYSEKFTQQNAQSIVQQAFADYCAELESASSKQLSAALERAHALLGATGVAESADKSALAGATGLAESADKLAGALADGEFCLAKIAQMPTPQEFAQHLTAASAPQQIGKYLGEIPREQTAMQQAFEAVFNNCDLSEFAQPRAREFLQRAFAEAAARLLARVLPLEISEKFEQTAGDKIAQISELLGICEQIAKGDK